MCEHNKEKLGEAVYTSYSQNQGCIINLNFTFHSYFGEFTVQGFI